MKKLLSKFRIVVPVLICVFAFTTLLLTGCKEEIPHIHRLEHVAEKVATCTETGEREHYHCTLCDKNYLTEEAKEEVSEEDLIIAVDEDNHNYDFATAVYDFHLKAGSETEYECTATASCSRNLEHTKITEKTTNVSIQTTKDPDCTNAGEKVYTAEFTNKAFGKDGVVSETESIDALGHNYGTLITEVPATCLAKGTKAHYHCDRCNKDFLQQDGVVATAKDLTIEKSSHSMTRHERVEATCVNPGNIEYWHCSSCNKNYSDANGQTEVSAEDLTIAKLNHNYGDLIQEEPATCTQTGVKAHYHCDRCGNDFLQQDGVVATAENLVIAINPNNHNYNYVYDYTNSRYVAECTRCNHTDSTQTQTAGVEGYPYLVNNENTLLSAVESGGYIKLANDIAINGVIIISKDVNIDLNEKTISYTQTVADSVKINGTRKSYCIFNLTGGSSVVSNGRITYSVETKEKVSQGRVISIENDAQLVMQGLTITSELRGVMVFDNSQVTIQNCNITSSQDTISGNNTYGPTESKNLIVNIKDSSITSTNLTAVFVPSYMTLNIENSYITGNTSAIYAMMGVIKVDATSTLSSTRETFVARQDAPVSAEDKSNQLTNSGPGDESYDGATIVLRTNYYYDKTAKTNELTLNISDWSKVTAVSGVKAVVYNFAEDSNDITTARNAGNPITNQFAEVCNKLAGKNGVKYFLYTEEEGTTEGQKGLVELSYYQYWQANYAEYEVVNEQANEYNVNDKYWLFAKIGESGVVYDFGYSFVEQTQYKETPNPVSHLFVSWEQKDIANCGGAKGSLIAFIGDSSEKVFKVPTDEKNLSLRTLIEGHRIGIKNNNNSFVLEFIDSCIMVTKLENNSYTVEGFYNYTLDEKTMLITVTIAENTYRYFYLDYENKTVEEYVCKDSDGKYYTSFESALGSLSDGMTITLLRDVAPSTKLSVNPEGNISLSINLNGKTITLKNSMIFTNVRVSMYGGQVRENKDEGVCNYPIVIDSGTVATIYDLVIIGEKYGCFSIDASTATLTNVTATAQEMCVAVWKDTNVTIEDCIFTSKDNGVIMDNGSAELGNNTVVIRGTTLNAHIKTSGYIACGIYHANSGTWTIGANSEGKNSVINVYSGAGIVARSGDFVIEKGVTINHSKTEHPDLTEGKVGDAKINIVIPVDIYRDLAANYPGGKPNVITNNSSIYQALQTQFECVDDEGYYYTSFEKLIAELSGDTTITLLKDITLQEKLSISPEKTCNIVLDLGEHSINGAMTSGSMIHVKGCNLTITNGNIVSANAGVGVIRVQGREGADSASTMTDPVAVPTSLKLDATLNITSKSYCLLIFGSGAVVETSANLTNNSTEANVPAVIQTNGNKGSEIGSLTINGGTITHNTDVAMYLPAAGNYTINGGTISGTTAVYVKSGVLTINGGTLKATANKADFAHNGNGCYYTGDALVIEACNYPGGVPTANINDGTFIIADNTAKQIGVYNYAGYEAKINNITKVEITPESVSKQS